MRIFATAPIVALVTALSGVSVSARAQSRIIHQPVDTMLAGQALIVRATLREDFVEMAQLRLYYRWKGAPGFLRKNMSAGAGGTYVGCIPGGRVAQTRLQYFLEAVDVKGRRLAAVGSRRRPVRVRLTLGPGGGSAGQPRTCDDGAGQPDRTAPPTPTQLRRLAYRKRSLALEARGVRLRSVGRGLVIGGLSGIALSAVFFFRAMSEGPVFLWVGVGIGGLAALVALIGTPLWVVGAKQIKRAHHQLVKPEARGPVTTPAEDRRRVFRLSGGLSRRAVFGWRFRF